MGVQVLINAGIFVFVGVFILLLSPWMAMNHRWRWDTYNGTDLMKDRLAYDICVVYFEVLGVCQLQSASLLCAGPKAFFLAFAALVAVMAKHFFVDGLQPPVAVVVSASAGLLASLISWLSNKTYGRWFYVAFASLSAVKFVADPAGTVKNTWPAIEGENLKNGIYFVEMIAYYFCLTVVYSVLRESGKPTKFALAVNSVLGVVCLVRARTAYLSCPPMSYIFICAGLAAYNLSVFFNRSPKAKYV